MIAATLIALLAVGPPPPPPTLPSLKSSLPQYQRDWLYPGAEPTNSGHRRANGSSAWHCRSETPDAYQAVVDYYMKRLGPDPEFTNKYHFGYSRPALSMQVIAWRKDDEDWTVVITRASGDDKTVVVMMGRREGSP